jgi:hypothetical protein
MSFPIKELSDLAPVLSWASVPSGPSHLLRVCKRYTKEEVHGFEEMTLFADHNLKGGPKDQTSGFFFFFLFKEYIYLGKEKLHKTLITDR